MQLLGRHQRKAVGQIEPHLVAEDAPRAGAGAVALGRAVIENVLQQVEILSHAVVLAGVGSSRQDSKSQGPIARDQFVLLATGYWPLATD